MLHQSSIPLGPLAILLLIALVSPATIPIHGQAPGEGLRFTDVTAQAGVALRGTLTESVAWGDYDDDGDQDLYLTNDGPNRLFRNDGGDTIFTEVAGAVGVAHPGFSVGAAFGDLDNDGDLDLYVVSFGSGPDALYRNDGPIGAGGAHTFTDVTTAAGVTDESSSRGVAFVDYDRDGLLDVYVNAIGPDILYHNLGGLRFTNVASALGVATAGQGVGVVASDLDGNGWPDLFTGNRSNDPNRLYLNDGGTFTDVTASAGIDKVGLGMGVLSFDYDNDLDFDLYWTSWPLQPNALYENLGGGTRFVDVALLSGTLDGDGWGISCNAGDVDNDGWDDFFVTNGFDSSSSPNVLFLNERDGTFRDVTERIGGAAFDGRGVAFADYDNDGDLDLCVTGGPDDTTRLWRNDTIDGAATNGNRWITLELVGTASNRSAIGARVEVETDLGTTVKEVSGGAGRGSQNSLPLEFGLAQASAVTEVRIRWPNGRSETLRSFALDRFVTIVEGESVDGCPITAGDPAFCEVCGPCREGQGGCRTDDECADGLVCMENFGAAFGLAPRREVCVVPGGLAAPPYALTELPALEGGGGPLDSITTRAFNNVGQVVGRAEASGGGSSGFRFTPGVGMEKLDPRGNDASTALAINEAGDVFGYLLAPGTPRRAGFFLFRDGGFDLLEAGASHAIRGGFELHGMNEAGDLVGGVLSRARGLQVPYLYSSTAGWSSLAGLDRRFSESSTVAHRINDAGEIVLVTELGGGESEAFALFEGERLFELGNFGGRVNVPGAINDNGRVVGEAHDSAGRARAYVLQGRRGRVIDVHPRGFQESRALAVNAKGVVGGVLVNASPDTLFTWDARRQRKFRVQARRGELRALLGTGASFGEVHVVDINERLEFVGRVDGTDAEGAALERFFYFSSPYGLLDVQDLLAAAGSTRTVTGVVGINDWGEILIGYREGGKSGAIVLTPLDD